jgi:hypothetical protein
MSKTAAQLIRELMNSIGASVAPEVAPETDGSIDTPIMTSVVAQAQFSPQAISDLSDQLNPLLADVFAIYLKTKNFHWHMNGSHFRLGRTRP